jgi:opacity protein-like surface antigen
MIRHVSAVVIGLCLSTSPVYGQTTTSQGTEITVRSAPAEVHKSPTVASAIIGKAPIGTTLEIKRNLGSWVAVPWPGGDNGVAFVHVNAGTIGPRTPQLSAQAGAVPASAQGSATAGTMTDGPAALADRILNGHQNGQPSNGTPRSSTERSNILLPPHTLGMGARINALTPGFGAGFGVTTRKWWHNAIGVQFEVLHSRLGNLVGPGHVTSLQFAPSVMYSLPDVVANSLWVRPYAGGGMSFNRASIHSGDNTLQNAGSETRKGWQAFGGVETTFAAVPQVAWSAELGYRRLQTSAIGFEPKRLSIALAGHWYLW